MILDASPQVAVEIDLLDDRSGMRTLRLCNRGPLFSIAAPSENYEPALETPLGLGVAISAETYGQPTRENQTGGTIEFLLDLALATKLFDNALHWIGRAIRVYSGQPHSAGGFREDLSLVFNAIVTDITHDTKRASVRMADASVLLDVPLISDLYSIFELAAIAGKPRPQAWGTVYNIEPVLKDDVNLVFEISRRPIISVIEARVGGVPWISTGSTTPGAGEYHVDAAAATIRFGSGLNGGDVRLDVHATDALGVGALATQVLADHPEVPLDGAALSSLDVTHAMTVGYYALEPTNCLTVLDDIFGGVGAWWGIDLSGTLTAGFIAPPADDADISVALDTRNVISASLSGTLVPARRVPVEYERHWQPESQYFTAVSPHNKQRWSSPGLTVTREDSDILIAEPRAYDVPTIRSVAVLDADGASIADRFFSAWNEPRKLIDVTVMIDPMEIKLYGTIRLDYMMFAGNYRVISSTPSVGGGAAQLRLWG